MSRAPGAVRTRLRGLQPLAMTCALLLAAASPAQAPPGDRVAAARERVAASLQEQLERRGLRWGAPLLIRIFKEDNDLEVWIDDGDRYRLFRSYAICRWSGTPGPKLREGDGQAPEGFYSVRRGQLKPDSDYHLAFNLGFPNAYDRALGRTGSFLMVHGDCVSVGCYAMGDAQIEEIYTLMDAAFAEGQASVPVQAFPFRFELRPEAGWVDHPWADFWRNLREGHDAFDRTGRPPRITVADGRYVVTEVP